ncbi:MAG TPA: flagellar export chaperone FliS [Tepidiformaceae bacterium]|nr:flagellar export chaperone FliS [Thermoflexaceae bacterium]HMS58502.1 flagellar export chaperone FliS [Tepidiformaceae bacterium]
MTTEGYNAYRTVGTTTADPVTLTTMLYDGALKALRRARMFAQQGETQRFFDETGRAHLIVGELLATLDMEQGGEIARTLSALYVYCMRCIIEARADNTAMLDEAERHITRITEAWKKATDELRTQAASGAAAEAVA